MTTLTEKLRRLPAARRRKIEARAAALIAEEMSLQDLRRARQLTQAHLAERLGTGQDSISRLEQRSDLLISTLRHYVEELGGRLALVAEFQDRAPVRLQGFSTLTPEASVRARPRRRTLRHTGGASRSERSPKQASR
jgi:transcriptional regulator with XRE-family HTH domain